MSKVLIVEDDSELATEVSKFLESKELVTTLAFDSKEAIQNVNDHSFDTMLLDINIPGLNGIELCAEFRKKQPNASILMLTAFSGLDEKIRAFENGADDYLVKPFHFAELYARIVALKRRKNSSSESRSVIQIADLKIEVEEKRVLRDNKEIMLTPKEFKLLLILAEANGRVISKAIIAEKLWDYHIETSQNTIEVYINFLRNKIDKNFNQKLIHTKSGYGYYLKTD